MSNSNSNWYSQGKSAAMEGWKSPGHRPNQSYQETQWRNAGYNQHKNLPPPPPVVVRPKSK